MAQKTGLAVLVRHGQSQWNLENRFTGWHDIGLTEKGREQARQAGALLKASALKFDRVFVSVLCRAGETADLILQGLAQEDLPRAADAALNERDYGRLTGLNKVEAAKTFGAAQIHAWRRGFASAPPEGESLKDTAARVLPYFRRAILPHLQAGEKILICAHGNSLRALIMHLENVPEEKIPEIEIATGEIWLVPINAAGEAGKRKILRPEV